MANRHTACRQELLVAIDVNHSGSLTTSSLHARVHDASALESAVKNTDACKAAAIKCYPAA
eukprot:scaffold230570_cov32-Prasinocladus_malaysianus.AAC.1